LHAFWITVFCHNASINVIKAILQSVGTRTIWCLVLFSLHLCNCTGLCGINLCQSKEK